MSRKKPIPYVNNKHFYEALKVYHAEYHKAKAAGAEKPPIPNYISICIMEIANKFSKKGNFAGYSYIDDMVGDAIENCCRYVHVFNPERGNNPFAFFTQTVRNAFIKRIELEHKQAHIKNKVRINAITNGDPMDDFDVEADDHDIQSQSLADLGQISDAISSFERKENEKKLRRKETKTLSISSKSKVRKKSSG